MEKLEYGFLQLFAGPTTPVQGGQEPEEDEELEPEEEEEELIEPDEDAEPEADEEPATPPAKGQQAKADKVEKPAAQGDKLFTQAEVDRIVQKRLARGKDEDGPSLCDRAEVPSLSQEEQVDAVRLWAYLKHNAGTNAEVTKIIKEREKQDQMPAYLGRKGQQAKPEGGSSEVEMLDTKYQLRSTDKVFRKYEKSILAYAEANDIPVNSPKNLRLAYQAWKGEKLPLLLANAEQNGANKAKTAQARAAAASGTPRKGKAAPGKTDYTKMSVAEFCETEGLTLIDND